MPCLQKPSTCSTCYGHTWGANGYVPGYGTGDNGVLLVGESAGGHEAENGVPFFEKAQAGSLAERAFKLMGSPRESYGIHNVLSCRPPDDYLDGAHYEQEVTNHCKRNLLATIYTKKPKVIVPLGNVPMRWFFPEFGRGEDTGISAMRGYVLGKWVSPEVELQHSAWVLPSFHFSYLARGEMRFLPLVMYDITKAREIAAKGWEYDKPYTIEHPTVEQVERLYTYYKLHPQEVIDLDIETPNSHRFSEDEAEEKDPSYQLIRISFVCPIATATGIVKAGITVLFQEPFTSWIRSILALPNPKRTWNGRHFDIPRLAYNGFPINGRHYDLIWAAHFLQPTFPLGLGCWSTFHTKLPPWKYMGQSKPEYYSCLDAIANYSCGDGLFKDLKSQGQWEAYERHVVEVLEVLDQVKDNGLPIDEVRRGELKVELEGKLEATDKQIVSLVPEAILPTQYLPKEGYKRVPKDLTGLIQRDYDVVDEAGKIITVTRWCRVVVSEFNPGSWQQVLSYIKFKGHKVPLIRKKKKPSKSGKKLSDETTDKESLKALFKSTKDPFYKLVIERRAIDKVLGTYVEGWKAGKDGRVHPTASLRGDMHRISWKQPNIAATVADKDEAVSIASGFRECVRAREGYVLVETDWSGIEALLVGWFAEDEQYMRLCRLGVHDYLLSHMLNKIDKVDTPAADLAWEDSKLKAYFKQLKAAYPKRRDDAKHCIHGVNYGMLEKLMSELYGMSQVEARQLIDLYFSLFPKIKLWQDKVVRQANVVHKLRNPFNYTMDFWDVMRWDSKRYYSLMRRGVPQAKAQVEAYVRGEGAKAALSFYPRDTAAGMLKEVLLHPAIQECNKKGWIIGTAHDAILREVPEEVAMENAKLFKEVMEAPFKQLNGLWCGTETVMGKVWSKKKMEVVQV